VLPVERGGPRRRLDAAGVRSALEALVDRRGLGGRVTVRGACAGGCHAPGPNVSVAVYPPLEPGRAPSHVALGWRTFVYSLGGLDCLAAVLEDQLSAPAAPRSGRAAPAPTPRSAARRPR
jgi:hypothetical protein